MGLSALLAELLVHCIPACTSPVAVRVAVNPSEQTPIADLLITSDNRGDAGVCTGCKSPYLTGRSSLACRALHRIAFPVVSGVRRSRGAGSIESRRRAGPRKGSQLSRPPEHGNLESWRIPPSLGNNPPLSRSGSSRHRASSTFVNYAVQEWAERFTRAFDNVDYLLERVGLAEKEG